MVCLSLWASKATATPTNLSKVITTSSTSISVAQAPPLAPNVSPESQPNRQRFLQPAPTPSTAPQENHPVINPPQTPENVQPSSVPEQRFFVSKIEVIDSKVLRPAQLNQIVQPFEGRYVTLEELRGVADTITQLYLNRGYITSRAVLVNQKVVNGVVQIRVFEGGVERIEIQGTHQVNPEYIRSRIQLAGLKPLRKDKLEDQLLLLRADPLFKNVEASLRPGSQIGQSILIVRVSEASPFVGALSSDNYSPPSVGGERFGVGLSDINLTGIGDQIAAAYNRSTTGGANLYDFSYRIPLNPMNGTLQVSADLDYYKITDPAFAALGIRGHSNLYQISYRQPLIRTPREEMALSLGFAYQDGRTFLFDNLATPFGIGPDRNGISRTSVFLFGQDYVRRYPKGALALRSQFSFGTGLLDATINRHPIPDSRFFSWLGQVQRVQQLSTDQLLIGEIDLQLTPNSLLPSQEFVIGGGQSVRGYRQNARYGDNGIRFSVEDRIALLRDTAGAANLQVAPFVDLGYVWNTSGNPNPLPPQTFLPGAGLGLLWEPLPRLNVRLDYGIPLINLRNRGGSYNIQDSGFYFSVNYQP